MRLLSSLSSLAIASALYAQGASPTAACIVAQGTSSANVVQLRLVDPGTISTSDLQLDGNWSVSTILHSYTFKKTPIRATPISGGGEFLIVLTPDTNVDYTAGDALVRFASPTHRFESVCHPGKISPTSRLPKLYEDPKDADISIMGALQTGVGDKPKYSYTFDGKYDLFSAGAHALSVSFKAVASEQGNADPDSMKLAGDYRFLANLPGQWGLIVKSNPIAYEFERKVKEDKPVALGQPIPKYIDKNSNLVPTAQILFIRSTNLGSFFFRPLGIEAGSSLSRTIHVTSATSRDTKVLRGVFGADYYMFWKDRLRVHRIDFEAHHTQRVLAYAEPFARAGINGGNQYLSRFARPITTAKVAFSPATGAALSFSYSRGSLPPSFEFIDHRLTIGLTMLFKRN